MHLYDTLDMTGRPPERTNAAIARRLKLLRALRGMQQKEFALYVGIAATTYNNYEKEVNQIIIDNAFKIAEKMQVTVDWIYSGNPIGVSSQRLQELEEQAQKVA